MYSVEFLLVEMGKKALTKELGIPRFDHQSQAVSRRAFF